jgi:hypothetical protein
MTPDESKKVNNLIQALTNQRNAALNEAANYAALVMEKDEMIKALQEVVAEQVGKAQPVPFALGDPGSNGEAHAN